MPTPGFVALSETLLQELRAIVGDDHFVIDDSGLSTLSKDFYWYSPVLRDRLEDRLAAAAVRVTTIDQLRAVVALAATARVPLTMRGAATGNYGQSVPLYGGLIVDLSGMDRIIDLSEGVVTAEPGARLATIENQARPLGWELRCYPSTWVKSTIAGFVSGGSGGIGSISHGGLREPGTIKRFKIMTIEEEPRILTLDETETMRVFHAYGTNGIIVEVQLRLAPAYPWQQLVIASTNWDPLLDFAAEIAGDATVRKRLVSVMENPIGSFFKPIKKFYPADHHLIFFEVDESSADAVAARAEAAGLSVPHRIPYHYPRKPPMLSDYTWNHTTLWALKADPAWTYLQSGFGANYREQFQLLHAKFPGEILFHLEFTRGNPKMGGASPTVACGGIPLVHFKSEERLKEIIEYCTSIGVFTANPHTCYIEEGGRDQGYDVQLELKHEADPHNLLNPGKMKQAPTPRFAVPGSMPHFLFS
ncbi:FAD-binding oxidoreductase [Synoicihabitans lomoniglobus]|uniref:FAD-binding oxidoreductase n=1 Tax=Synoicihabitans lomoniglobus TaxID=2909285 RepID=A0AAF0CR93_9BACT|nr:FAD-binding oxidoreductase [Opitutaceae bacterium LMO-M01]WED66617.1 FAD-binding oxidoreductase [Opitutaceae bacterium LMO-M01]